MANKMTKQKVLICTPTSSYKDYCLQEWAKSIKDLTYPADILILDNTKDNGEHIKVFEKLDFGNREAYFMYAPPTKEDFDLRYTMCRCNNLGLQFAIENGYDYMMSIESDVFAPCNNAIELLLEDKKDVVGFQYFIDKWHFSRSIVPNRFYFEDNTCVDYYGDSCLDAFFKYTTGKIELVPSLGLGFVLINIKNVFSKVPFFRISTNEFLTQKAEDKIHADTFFYVDLAKYGIPTYCDTRYTCDHKNLNWLEVWENEKQKSNKNG